MDLGAITLEKVTSPADLMELQENLSSLTEFSTWPNPLPVRWAFRGQSQDYGTLMPSFQRLFEQKHPFPAAELIEKNLIETFREQYAKLNGATNGMPTPDLIDAAHALRCLSVMQHYGVPTRLLDWTSKFWIAVYFACAGDKDKDGELWYYDRDIFFEQLLQQRDYALLQHWLGDPSAFREHTQLRPDLRERIVDAIRRLGFNPDPPHFLNDLLNGYGTRQTPPPQEPDLLSQRGGTLVIELDPQITPRMREQFAHHTLSSNLFADHAPLLCGLAQSCGLDTHVGGYFHRVVIAAGCKERTLQFLSNMLHVTAGSIFPDVEGLSKFLHWHLESLMTTLL